MVSLTSPILLAQVGEPPNVSKSDAVAEEGEEELEGVAPLRPVARVQGLLEGLGSGVAIVKGHQ